MISIKIISLNGLGGMMFKYIVFALSLPLVFLSAAYAFLISSYVSFFLLSIMFFSLVLLIPFTIPKKIVTSDIQITLHPDTQSFTQFIFYIYVPPKHLPPSEKETLSLFTNQKMLNTETLGVENGLYKLKVRLPRSNKQITEDLLKSF